MGPLDAVMAANVMSVRLVVTIVAADVLPAAHRSADICTPFCHSKHGAMLVQDLTWLEIGVLYH